MDMIDMRIAYEEIALYSRISKELEERKSDSEDRLLGLHKPDGTVKKIVKMSEKEIDEEFDSLDLTKY